MRKLSVFILVTFVFFGCKQVSESIEETINPVDSVAGKEKNVKGEELETSGEYTSSTTTSTTTTTSATHSVEHREGENVGFLGDTAKLLQAESLLKKLPQYAGKEMYIYSNMSFYDDGRIYAAFQHPVNPKYVDNYQYEKGKWTGPKPEQLSVKDNIKDRLVPLSQISFANVTRVNRIYKEKASEIEGAKQAVHIYFNIWNNKIHWFPTSISGSRERYSIEFNTDGTLKSFKQE